MRTLKQQWASERCWMNKGSLAGVISRLNQIARSRSTLPHESAELREAASLISNTLDNWNDSPHGSWYLFERRSK